MIKVEFKSTNTHVLESRLGRFIDKALEAHDLLESKKGLGSDFLGWLELPSKTKEKLLKECREVASKWNIKGVKVAVVIGIGGSYLGAKAAIEALSHSFADDLYPNRMKVVFAGHNLSEDYLSELLDMLENKSFSLVVISKSGTTTEPAVAFRILKKELEKRYGVKEAAERIVAVTDKKRGALKGLAKEQGYKTFVIEDNIGGRFSVLSPVGLLPIAIAGFDIEKLIEGARDMEAKCKERSEKNPSIMYAAIRNFLYSRGKLVEILVNYNPKLQYLSEWWKQLYGESEGKEGKGIFPASVNNTTDLHSMGQYIQDGERILFETILNVKNSNRSLIINEDSQDIDGLNFLKGRHVEECNKMAEVGTMLAHIDGGVPNIYIEIERLNEYNLGVLFYFFEKACGVSAYILGVNPFDQPGVEAYKKNMFSLLGKPGFEKEGEALRSRINKK